LRRCCCSFVKKLMGGAVFLRPRGRAEQLPDAAGEVALEAADGLAVRLAFVLLASEELDRFGVTARLPV